MNRSAPYLRARPSEILTVLSQEEQCAKEEEERQKQALVKRQEKARQEVIDVESAERRKATSTSRRTEQPSNSGVQLELSAGFTRALLFVQAFALQDLVKSCCAADVQDDLLLEAIKRTAPPQGSGEHELAVLFAWQFGKCVGAALFRRVDCFGAACMEVPLLLVHPEVADRGHGGVLLAHVLQLAARARADAPSGSSSAVVFADWSSPQLKAAENELCLGLECGESPLLKDNEEVAPTPFPLPGVDGRRSAVFVMPEWQDSTFVEVQIAHATVRSLAQGDATLNELVCTESARATLSHARRQWERRDTEDLPSASPAPVPGMFILLWFANDCQFNLALVKEINAEGLQGSKRRGLASNSFGAGRASWTGEQVGPIQLMRMQVVYVDQTGGDDVEMDGLHFVTPDQALDLEAMHSGYATHPDGSQFDGKLRYWMPLSAAVGGIGWRSHLNRQSMPPPALLGAHREFPTAAEVVGLALNACDWNCRAAPCCCKFAGAQPGDFPACAQLPPPPMSPAPPVRKQSKNKGSRLPVPEARDGHSNPRRAAAVTTTLYLGRQVTPDLGMVELMCGTAHLARKARYGFKNIRVLDWKTDRVPLGDGDDQIRKEEFLHMNIADVDLRCLDKLFPFPVHWVHCGFDCMTFTYLALELSKRHKSNSCMGASSDAWRANVWLQHTMAILLLLRQRNPALEITFENPKATMVGHPLIRHLFEVPRPHGLNQRRFEVTYCLWGHEAMKPTFIWSPRDNSYVKQLFVGTDGTPNLCKEGACVCQYFNNFRKHKQEIKGSKAQGIDIAA